MKEEITKMKNKGQKNEIASAYGNNRSNQSSQRLRTWVALCFTSGNIFRNSVGDALVLHDFFYKLAIYFQLLITKSKRKRKDLMTRNRHWTNAN